MKKKTSKKRVAYIRPVNSTVIGVFVCSGTNPWHRWKVVMKGLTVDEINRAKLALGLV